METKTNAAATQAASTPAVIAQETQGATHTHTAQGDTLESLKAEVERYKTLFEKSIELNRELSNRPSPAPAPVENPRIALLTVLHDIFSYCDLSLFGNICGDMKRTFVCSPYFREIGNEEDAESYYTIADYVATLGNTLTRLDTNQFKMQAYLKACIEAERYQA